MHLSTLVAVVGIWSQFVRGDEQFDYIVIGGGTAGLTIANRLTEDSSVTVLVLEAGEDRSDDLNVLAPGLFTFLYGNPDYDYDYKTVPQEHANGQVLAQIRGKQLGGSSAMNFMFWTHASRGDIDAWGTLGNPGWSWDELEPYYTKSEKYAAPSVTTEKDLDTGYIVPSLHGAKGNIHNTFPDGYGPLDEAWPATFEALDLAVKSDPRDGLALGGYTNLLNIRLDNHTRSYAATAYYNPIAGRPNLFVLTGAIVKRVLLDDGYDGVVATGVEYVKDNVTLHAAASKEVIVCAGSIGSPQVLEVSGIGDAAHLGSFGLHVYIDNPNVGENLQDHAYVPLGFEVNPGIPTIEDFLDETYFDDAYAQYVANQTGPLATTGASSALLALNQITNVSLDIEVSAKDGLNSGRFQDQYDVLLKFLQSEAVTQELTITGGMSPWYANDSTKLFTVFTTGHYFSLLGVLEHPFSRGSVHIQSNDTAVYPLLDPNYLAHPLDLQILSTIALHLQDVIAQTRPLSDLLAGNGTVFQPGYHRLTEANVADWVRGNIQSEYHPAGTCAMLPRASGGVVDEKFLVHGAANLRVVDASVFPLLPRANLQTLVYAIAERAADFIKEAQALLVM
ncbi:GMC oxidoreductase [Xylariales sp. PMI_506]|nr:GMC oxidoreductase [Xylariales sp. PMI_506]